MFNGDGEELNLEELKHESESNSMEKRGRWSIIVRLGKIIAKWGKKAWAYIWCVGAESMLRCDDEVSLPSSPLYTVSFSQFWVSILIQAFLVLGLRYYGHSAMGVLVWNGLYWAQGLQMLSAICGNGGSPRCWKTKSPETLPIDISSSVHGEELEMRCTCFLLHGFFFEYDTVTQIAEVGNECLGFYERLRLERDQIHDNCPSIPSAVNKRFKPTIPTLLTSVTLHMPRSRDVVYI